MLIGAVLTDGSKHFFGFTQFDENWQYKVGSNLSSLPVMANGSTGGPSTLAPVAVGGFIPAAIASQINVGVQITANTTQGSVAPNSSYTSYAQCPITISNGQFTGTSTNTTSYLMNFEGSNIYWACNDSANGMLICNGFTINL